MKQLLRSLCIGILVVWAAPAHKLRLKNLTESGAVRPEERNSRRTRFARTNYLLVQYDRPVNPAEAAELRSRGARILAYVPDNAYLISAPDGMSLSGLGVVSAGRLPAALKVSHAAAPADLFVVEFHPDVEFGEARRLVEQHGLEVREHPDLLLNHLLAAGAQSDVAMLAELEEVAYVFPASRELASYEPLIGCAGAVFQAAESLVPMGQYVSHAGDGWDGPGQNAAELNYVFGALTGKLPQGAVIGEILRAFEEWSGAVRVTFRPGGDATASRTLHILSAAGSHGDPFAFDGPGRILAHTFYPAPPNPEPIAGDLHLDDDENWQIGADIDVYSVVLHELGHALGLGHSDVPGAVMYPYYRRVTKLTGEDILAIRELYAAPDSAPTPPPTVPLEVSLASHSTTTANASIALSGTVAGGRDTVRVTWSTNAGTTGTATGSRSWFATVPLVTGQNQITITATDADDQTTSVTTSITRRPDPVPVSMSVTAPTSATTFVSLSQTVSISGTASHPSGIGSVRWTDASGGSGTATVAVFSGIAHWTASAILLRPGTNTLTFRALAAEGSAASVTVTVTYTPQTGDTTRPSLAIHAPASSNVVTTAAQITFRGVASDNVAVTSVTCAAPSGTINAAGTTYWTCENIPLRRGLNMVMVQARDAAGNMAWRSVGVTRQ